MISLSCGDGIAGLRSLPRGSVNMILTDPPYGVTALGWDVRVGLPEFWDAVRWATGPAVPIVCFSSGLFTVDLIQSNRSAFRYRLVWHKRRPTGFLGAKRRPLTAHEDICVFWHGRAAPYFPVMTTGHRLKEASRGHSTGVYGEHRKDVTYSSTERYPTSVWSQDVGVRGWHPTQKPVDLLVWLIRLYSAPGAVVADPFAGSASTGHAARSIGRGFLGWELDPLIYARAKSDLESF